MNESGVSKIEALFRSADEREEPISSEEFMEAGWSFDRFLDYVELCITLQACAITATFGGARADEEKRQLVLKRMFRFLSPYITGDIEPKFNMMFLLTGECNRDLGSFCIGKVFFSPDSFRRRFEGLLWITLNDKSIWAEPAPQISGISKEEASRKIRELENLQMEAENSIPPPLIKYTDYSSFASWADQTDKAYRELSNLEDEISRYEEYVKDFDAKVPYDAITKPLYVHKGMIKCERNCHEVISKTAFIVSDRDRKIEMNVNYCTKCMKHFMSYDEYSRYYKLYGKLLGKLILVESDESASGTDYPIALESPLKLCGYSVSQQEGLTTTQRQSLLAKMMNLGIVSKSDIIRYLDYFITFNGRKIGNELAVDKWENDLWFVRNYEIDRQERIMISDIRRHK